MEPWRPSHAGNVSLRFTSHSENLRRAVVTRPSTFLLYSDLQERGSEMIGTKTSSGARWAGAAVLSLVMLVWSGCGGGMNAGGSSSGSTSNGMSVTPSNATLRAGGATQFSASVTGNKSQSVTWYVNGTPSGNATVGTIDATGKYTAPAALPTPASMTIKAVSVADKSLSGTSSVSLENPIPVLQTISPIFLPVGSFSLQVGGANFVKGSQVIFGGTALATTYLSPTQLTATGTAASSQVGMVKVTVQNPDP